MNYQSIIGIFLDILLILFLFVLNKQNRQKLTVKLLARTAVISAISIILYVVPFFNLNVPFFPSFLQIHLDEIPAFIGGFAYGPISAVLILVIKTLAKLPSSTTMYAGEIFDLIISLVFVLPAVVIYKKKKTFKNVLIAFGVSSAIQVVFASIFSTYVAIPFYLTLFPLNIEIGPKLLFATLVPFNLFKDAIVIIITLLIYKKLHNFIDRLAD